MKETNKNSNSWWNNPALAEQAKQTPVVVTEENKNDYTLIDGNHRSQAFAITEAAEVPQVVVEVAQPKVPKKRGRPEKVSKDIFREVWNKCETLDEVAETLGLPRTSVSVKASNMRKMGCTMKRMKKARKPSC